MLLAPRHLPRLAAIAGLFTRYGLAKFAKDQGILALVRDPHEENGSEPSEEKASAFRERLVELGPAYIKLGQLLSSRVDLLPPAYIAELQKLQSDVEPVPFEELRAVIEEELQGRLGKLFETFDTEPLGSASLGQAHAATLRGGRAVVVKVQRPHVRETLAEDIEFFREVADFLTAHTEAGARIDMIGVIREVERALADELDYRVEARNTAHFRRALATFPRLLAPRVIDGYCTERVLTTERIRGVHIDEISPLARMETDFHPLADDLMRAYLKQIVIDGYFHADPHAGNAFVILPGSDNPPTPSEIATFGDGATAADAPPSERPLVRIEHEAQRAAPYHPEPVEVKLALIDFGMTARLSPSLRASSVRVLLGLVDDRGEEVAEELMAIGEQLDGFDRPGFVSSTTELVGRAYQLNMGELDAGHVLYEVINASYTHGLRLPAEFTMLARTLAHLGVVTRALDPGFEPLTTVRAYISEIASAEARRQLNPRHLYRLVSESVEVASMLPRRLDTIIKRVADNEFRTRLDLPQITTLLEGMQKVANRVFSGLVLAGLLVASAMLLSERPMLGTVGFVIAGVIALYMIGSILWTDRRDAGGR